MQCSFPRLALGAGVREIIDPLPPLLLLPVQEALVRALTAMPQAQFEAAVGLVMAHHPGLQPYDDVGFDLDALDALTLRQMQVCVAVGAGAGGGPGLSVV